MGDNGNFAALDWVIGEIGETLKQARQALEAYVENSKDATRIRFCLTHIHQVHGSLKMVEFYGAALMAEEMEQLAQALMNGSVRNEPEGLEVLMRAILQLPLYLEHVKSSRKDQPTMVLPLLNDLRAVRGENLLTATQLFSPDMSAAKKVTGQRIPAAEDARQFADMIGKLRQMYQMAAAGVIRGEKFDESLGYLHKVFSRLHKLTQGTPRQPLWEIALALVEGLQNDSIEASVSVKNLLRQLDREIKVLAVHGLKALKAGSPHELLKNLLYYIARADSQAPQIQQIKEKYKLAEALPSANLEDLDAEDLLSGPDSEAMRSVVAAIGDELDIIKHAMDMCLSGENAKLHVQEALPVLKRVADTMAVLGIGGLRQKILAQAAVLGRAEIDPDLLTHDVLMGVAGEIIDVENGLQNLARNAGNNSSNLPIRDINLNEAQEQVLRECRNGLEQAKDAVIEYIASQWDQSHLANVPKLLREIRGGLDMVPLSRPARIIGACARFVEENLLGNETPPEWSTLDILADAITSVEYYLERLGDDKEEDDDLLLSVAEESVEALGYAVTPSKQKPETIAVRSDAESVLKKMVDVEDVDMNVPVSEAESHIEPASALGEHDAQPQETVDDSLHAMAANVSPEQHIEIEVDSTVDEDFSVAVEEAPKITSSVEPQEEEPEEIDEEIREIFVEEAEEVIDTINEYFPRWKEDLNDQESLTEFRRAFHTLKGSGRMVRAMDIGELAWSVESLLNRIIDGSVEPNGIHIDLIERVVSLLPSMIASFRDRQPNVNPALAQQYQNWAESLGKGNIPAELLAGVEVQVAAEVIEEEDDSEPDSMLWEIFGSEASTHLEVVESFIDEMTEQAPLYTPPSENMQRALHTLKGSAHMADVSAIAEMATPLERFVKELRSYQVNIDEDILQLLQDCVAYTREALLEIEQGRQVAIPRLQQFLARVAELRELSVGPLIRQQESAIQGKKKVDPELLSIFMAEEMNLLLEADEMLDAWQGADINAEQLFALRSELANLEKGAEHANLVQMSGLSGQLKQVYDGVTSGQVSLDGSGYGVLHAGHDALLDMVDAVAAGQNILPVADDVMLSLVSLAPVALEGEVPADLLPPESEEDIVFTLPSDMDASGNDIADVEAIENYASSSVQLGDDELELTLPDVQELDRKLEEDTSPFALDDTVFNASNLPDDSSDAEADTVVVSMEVPEALEASPIVDDVVAAAVIDSNIAEEEIDPEIFEIFLEEADELLEEVDHAINGWSDDWSNGTFLEELKRILHTLKGGARLAGLKGLGDISHEFEAYLIGRENNNVKADAGLFEVMHQYQDLLLNGTEKVRVAVHSYEPEGLAEAMRAIDSAAEAGLTGVSGGADEVVEPTDTVGVSDVDQRANDEDSRDVAEDSAEPSAPALVAAKVTSIAKSPSYTSADIIPFNPRAPAPSVIGSATKEVAKPSRTAAQLSLKRNQPQEVVKISADLLEELVNLAGETSISRGRMEEQVSEIGVAIDEMESTISRLQEQLRRLDIETEAQIIFRQEQLADTEDFDPLEMDRYSQLQQLSRSLIESASDLQDLKVTLTDKTRDAETLLLQQSRINTDLQEGLMRSRMVPFSRLVPRLRRIVRQVATELDRQVSFELDNAEGEMDRSVLERMVAPLEHMLRNAVDHGIEDAAGRKAAGKPPEGRIVLSLGREGGDVVLRLADDGRGINLERIRNKAIERGLMTADARLSDQEIMQFILSAGFTTAEKVTQISGRGVGMDVVHSEIKQLGGVMFIDSRYGEGTEFIIRLPFTVSVNRALMVMIGDDRYAIPLNTIEGIVRVSPFELEHYYQDADARFEYAGENYRVRYLGNMLNRELRPKLEGHALPLPVILVRSSEHAVALQVDTLMGSREVVVKTLGHQFSMVNGLSGATVMGDGSVVVILDLHAMIRKEAALSLTQAQLLELPAAAKEDVAKLVMVVDDSVTVRKVTSRFLEREGYHVVTAKDGADALRVLQDVVPDVMLLDIEMPRMDGFEVAKNIRSSSRLRDIPIIMITSRTGDKHRERAFELGVNKYMGKPYQEELLLANIRALSGEVEH